MQPQPYQEMVEQLRYGDTITQEFSGHHDISPPWEYKLYWDGEMFCLELARWTRYVNIRETLYEPPEIGWIDPEYYDDRSPNPAKLLKWLDWEGYTLPCQLPQETEQEDQPMNPTTEQALQAFELALEAAHLYEQGYRVAVECDDESHTGIVVYASDDNIAAGIHATTMYARGSVGDDDSRKVPGWRVYVMRHDSGDRESAPDWYDHEIVQTANLPKAVNRCVLGIVADLIEANTFPYWERVELDRRIADEQARKATRDWSELIEDDSASMGDDAQGDFAFDAWRERRMARR